MTGTPRPAEPRAPRASFLGHAAAHDRRRWLGLVLVALAAVGFASGSASAVIAYRAGASPLSVTTVRTTFALLVLVGLLRATGSGMRLEGKDRLAALALGLVLAVQSLSHYMGVQRLPLAIAILVFYLYPLFIAFGAHMSGQDRVTRAVVVSLVVAFAGIGLVLDVGRGGAIDAAGLVFPIAAAVCFAIVAVTSQPIMRRAADSRAVTLHLHITAASALALTCAVLGRFPLPHTQEGWIAFCCVPLLYAFSVISFFFAIAVIGSVRASLIMNLEPVAAIVLGFALLDQTLSPLQLVGAGLVVGAIVAVRWEAGRRGER